MKKTAGNEATRQRGNQTEAGGKKRPRKRTEATGTHIWQMHGGPDGCRSWNTVAQGTESSPPDDEKKIIDSKIIVRRRFCNDCRKPYAHVRVMQRGPQGWRETGSQFKHEGGEEGKRQEA